jgi:hypothetical protein
MLVDLHEVFERHNEEYIHFDRVASPRHPRPDMAAFLLLHELVPTDDEPLAVGLKRMVPAVSHDQVWLTTSPGEFAKVASEEHVIELLRCGVLYDEGEDAFYMFV